MIMQAQKVVAYQDVVKALDGYGDEGFSALDDVVCAVRPPKVVSWLDYFDYRLAMSIAYAALHRDPAVEFNKPADEIAGAMFREGWCSALRRVGALLGVDPAAFCSAMERMSEEEDRMLTPEFLGKIEAYAADEDVDAIPSPPFACDTPPLDEIAKP